MAKDQTVIMVIEDEVLLLEAIVRKLRALGIETISCNSGKQALDYLQELPALPDAVWLDFYLKDMNGLEFMQEVRKNNRWAGIPVIVVSNSASLEKVQEMMALGVKEYLLKAEHRLDDIVGIIKKYVGPKNEADTLPHMP